MGGEHEGVAEHPGTLEGDGNQPHLLAEFDSGLWTWNQEGQDSPGRAAPADDYVWDLQGGRRALLQLLLSTLRRGRALDKVSGNNQQQGSAPWGDHGLRGRNVLPGAYKETLQVLREAGHRPSDDVHARRH